MSTPNPNHPNNVNNQLNSGSSSGKINPLSSQKSVFVGNPHGNNQFNAPSNPPHINQNQQNFQGKTQHVISQSQQVSGLQQHHGVFPTQPGGAPQNFARSQSQSFYTPVHKYPIIRLDPINYDDIVSFQDFRKDVVINFCREKNKGVEDRTIFLIALVTKMYFQKMAKKVLMASKNRCNQMKDESNVMVSSVPSYDMTLLSIEREILRACTDISQHVNKLSSEIIKAVASCKTGREREKLTEEVSSDNVDQDLKQLYDESPKLEHISEIIPLDIAYALYSDKFYAKLYPEFMLEHICVPAHTPS